MRTYLRADIDKAKALWADFSDEWTPYRKLAEQGGLLFPPSGTKWDSWDDDSPSQRAMLIRAIRETPEATRRAIVGAPSWSVVLRRLLAGRDVDRAAITREEEPVRYTDKQAVERLSYILERIGR